MTTNDANTLLNLADISLYLSKNELEQEKYYSWVDETQRCRLIYLVKKAMRWAEPYYVSTSQFNQTGNYLNSLIGKWKAQAQNVLTVGSAGSIVNVVTGASASIVAFNLQFTVGGGTLSAGDITYILNYPYIMKDSVSVELPQSNLPISDTSQFSYSIVYTDSNATITFLNGTPNIGLQTGMEIMIRGLRFITGASNTGGSTAPTTSWTFQTVVTTGQTLSIPALIGKTLNIVFRATPIQVIEVGTPTSSQVLWNSTTGILTTPVSNPWVATEEVAIQYNV